MKYVISFALLLLISFGVAGCNSTPQEFRNMYSFGDTFVFNDLEIKFSDNIEWLNTNDSAENGYNKFRIPVEIINLARYSSRITQDYFTIFSPDGIAQPQNWWSTNESDITSMPRIRNGTSFTSYMYFSYEGRGNYVVEFRRLAGWDTLEPVEVWIPIR